MIILDGDFVSDEMKDFLNQRQIPVLRTKTAEAASANQNFNLVGPEDFAALYTKDSRILTTSEVSLQYVDLFIDNVKFTTIIDYLKNKAGFRQILKDLYPAVLYVEVWKDELLSFDMSNIRFPFVLKQLAGYSSKGVYIIFSREDWERALLDIDQHSHSWAEGYSGNVMESSSFVIESFLSGDEYAADGYFNENGEPVILNIMKHDFSSNQDVRDRLYYTSKEIIEDNLQRITSELARINEKLDLFNFPFHIELKINGEKVVPLEINPLRFAGLFTTDITYFAFGFKTYEYFFDNEVPDFDRLLAGKDGKIYSMIVLDKPKDRRTIKGFDFEKLKLSFEKVLCLRELELDGYSDFGVVFTETRRGNFAELENILHSDLSEFIIC